MTKKVFLVYPCGKRFELRVPILATDNNGNKFTVLPGSDSYLQHAKTKFQINNLKVVQDEIVEQRQTIPINFVSLSRKIRSIE